MDIQSQALTKTYPWREAPTAQFAVIAQDGSHSLSPLMHDEAFKEVGVEALYVAIDVPVGEVEEALDHLVELDYRGVNVTLPHKAEARTWATCFQSDYSEVQVVNTLRLEDRAGFNTDTVGFARSIEKFNLADNDRVLVLGAGGSALAVVAVLAQRLGDIWVWNRTPERALEIASKFPHEVRWSEAPSPKECRMIVNATSAGKYGQEPPVLWDEIGENCVAYDLFYSSDSTPFLKSAAAQGLYTQDGVELLVYQGAAAWPHWNIAAEPPIHQMEKTVRNALARRS